MVTSHDVARLAGVSQPTVSRALRGKSGASSATIARIRAAADSLGYVPSATGRSLSTQRTHRIGIVAGELTNPFYPELIEPMRLALRQQGYHTLLIPDAEDAPLQVDLLTDGSLDGVIITTSHVDSEVPKLVADRGVPCVLANRVVDMDVVDTCTFDNASGARDAARFIATGGHEHVGIVSGPRETSTGRQRHVTFRSELVDLGISVSEAHTHAGPFSFETGREAVAKFVKSQHMPTAIFCGNDVVAIGVCNALEALGQDVRRAVTVIGFDDIPMAGWEAFNLSTVRGDIAEMARESVRLVLRRIDDPGADREHVMLPMRLVVRD